MLGAVLRRAAGASLLKSVCQLRPTLGELDIAKQRKVTPTEEKRAAVRRAEGVAPGFRSPRSADPSSRTMWWTVESPFLNATVSPTAAGTGFGLYAVEPVDAPMLTTMLGPLGAGVGLGDAGEGALLE